MGIIPHYPHMFRRAAGHDNLGYRSCGHWDELLSDFEFEFSLVVEIDKVCVGHRYREHSCAILSSFKIMIIFNESSAEIKKELAYVVVVCYFSTVTVIMFIVSPTSSIFATAHCVLLEH